jgi:hypothetical protein
MRSVNTWAREREERRRRTHADRNHPAGPVHTEGVLASTGRCVAVECPVVVEVHGPVNARDTVRIAPSWKARKGESRREREGDRKRRKVNAPFGMEGEYGTEQSSDESNETEEGGEDGRGGKAGRKRREKSVRT